MTAWPVRASGCALTELDPVAECQTENEFWQVIVAAETMPAFLCDRSICLRSWPGSLRA